MVGTMILKKATGSFFQLVGALLFTFGLIIFLSATSYSAGGFLLLSGALLVWGGGKVSRKEEDQE